MHSKFFLRAGLILCLALATSTTLNAQTLSWFGATFAVVSVDEGSREWLRAGTSTFHDPFHGHHFAVHQGQTLHLGGQAQTFPQVYGVSVRMFWQVRQEVAPGTSLIVQSGNFPLPHRDQMNNNDRWEQHPVPGSTPGDPAHNVNVLAGLTPGQYLLQVWYRAQQGDTTIWDTRDGANYTATLTIETDPNAPPPGQSFTIPETPTSCDPVRIVYDATAGPLAAADQVYALIGFNGWLNTLELAMEATGPQQWEVVVPQRRLMGSLDWVFHDGHASDELRQWDNNLHLDWSVELAACDEWGDIIIEAPIKHATVPPHQRHVAFSGRTEYLEGPLHWINETTGQSGTVPAELHWDVSALPLGIGLNIIRFEGTAQLFSPNHGAWDCATNTVYQTDGWHWRQNAGQGWGEWALNVWGDGGYFLANDSSTNLVSHPFAWGLHSRNGGHARATRRLPTHLRVGETVQMKFENNNVQPGGSVGISLRDGFDQRLFTFMFVGGESEYQINDHEDGWRTGIPWKNTGLALTFELTSPTTYRFVADGQEFTGTLNPTEDGVIRLLRFWSSNAGSGGGHNTYLADLNITGTEQPPRTVTATWPVTRQTGADLHFVRHGQQPRIELSNAAPDQLYTLYQTSDLVHGPWTMVTNNLHSDADAISLSTSSSETTQFFRIEPQDNRTWTIDNPYATVHWDHHERHKSALHLHTTMSDGGGTPPAVVDRYRALGYSIITITDHDTHGPGNDPDHPHRERTTWPWESFGRIPEALHVIGFEGNEISRPAHIGSFFNDYGDAQQSSEDQALEEIAQRGGIAMMYHPGRYTWHGSHRTVDWYTQLYRDHEHLVGVEIYNQVDRYPHDRETWDGILTRIINERPVWGFSNDDMHSMSSQLGHNYNIMLLPELTEHWVRQSMIHGNFFYVHSPHAHHGPPPPFIRSISVNERDGRISIQTRGHDRIEWISDGNVIYTGDEIDLDATSALGSYVRAVVYAADSDALIGTQPFRIVPQTP